MIDEVVSKAPIFLLVAIRCFALLLSMPLFSMQTVPRTAKVALASYMAYIVLPLVNFSVYEPFFRSDGLFDLTYVFLLIGEAMIGVIIGFFVTIIFAAFSTAGQFFAFQMGLTAAEVLDTFSQVQNPVMGQFFNLMAMLLFLQSKWFQKLFLTGLIKSFQSLNVFSLLSSKAAFITFFLGSLSELFRDALVIALPVSGVLFLVNISLGVLARAAPQMNLFSEGFALLSLVSYFVISIFMPQLCDFFERSFNLAITNLVALMSGVQGG